MLEESEVETENVRGVRLVAGKIWQFPKTKNQTVMVEESEVETGHGRAFRLAAGKI